jgi:acetolactate synthase-1/2/3 large subunit
MKIEAMEVSELAGASSDRHHQMVNRSGAQMVVCALQCEGIDTVWGYPGGAVLPIYDALLSDGSIKNILVRHEQAAVHAADGFARATGKVGVALVTSGPGVTNAVTGIATAYFDSIPIVVICANVPTDAIGKDSFQECDAVGITRSIVKHNFLVLQVDRLASTLKKAFHIARSGRPGPVVIDIPKDVLLSHAPFSYSDAVRLRQHEGSTENNEAYLEKSVHAIRCAKRPLILVGGGSVASDASREIAELARRVDAPVANTLMALGVFPGTDPSCVGMPGMHGTYEANMAMQNSDVVIALGARFDDRVIGNTSDFRKVERTIIQIDVDPATIDKRVRVDVPLVGDVKAIVKLLLARLPSGPSSLLERSAWWRDIQSWRARQCLSFIQGDDTIKPQFVIEKLWEVTEGNAFVCSDVGQHQMWAAQLYRFDRPRRWINSGGLGTMGVGLPYAMGVKRAFPDADVFTVTGDGSIQMCMQELSTCKQYGFNVKVVCLNNGYLGMVRQLQHVHYEDRFSHSYMDALPDFSSLAKAYGHIGLRVDRPADVERALREARSLKDRTVFLDVVTDPTENVWPMVRAGSGLSDMLMSSVRPSN